IRRLRGGSAGLRRHPDRRHRPALAHSRRDGCYLSLEMAQRHERICLPQACATGVELRRPGGAAGGPAARGGAGRPGALRELPDTAAAVFQRPRCTPRRRAPRGSGTRPRRRWRTSLCPDPSARTPPRPSPSRR
ncbi:unnamed protein product, partial [Heterosigma akashiwo]